MLHGIEAGPFLGIQVAVGSHPAFRTPDIRLLIVQTPGFSGGQLPGGLSLVDSVLPGGADAGLSNDLTAP